MNTKHDVIIATGQNIDLLKVETNKTSSDIFDIFFTNGIIPITIRSTKITPTSATPIDNIYIKHHGFEHLKCAIILSDPITCHFCMFWLKFTCTPINDAHICMVVRSAEHEDWSSLTNDDNTDMIYDTFITKL